jgi:hypothetical protein
MRTAAIVGVEAVLGGLGCATTGASLDAQEREFASAARGPGPSLRVGEVRLVGARVHPVLPVGGPERVRVDLGGGRFVLCWTDGSVEQGRRALAQAFHADGSPAGEPAVISPADVDVLGAPAAVATDGRHVVATFAAASQRSVDRLSVSIETVAPGVVGDLTAQR